VTRAPLAADGSGNQGCPDGGWGLHWPSVIMVYGRKMGGGRFMTGEESGHSSSEPLAAVAG